MVQPPEFGDDGLDSTVILPLTTEVAPGAAFPTRVRVPRGVCALARDSDVMIDQILSWDNALFRKDLGLLPNALQDDVRAALKEFLDL